MKVLWKADLGQGKHDPLEVTHVVTKSGSQISADLVVPLDGLAPAVTPPQPEPSMDDGLLEVIDAQMAAIDELTTAAKFTVERDVHDDLEEKHRELEEWADQFPDMIEDLCMALGFARNPIAPTGIPELDIIVKLAR